MLKWFRRRFGKPDLDALLDELSPHHPGEEYTVHDRYRDYRALFFSSPLGRRVLWDILGLCRLYRPSMSQDPYKTAFNEGKRDAGLQILTVMNFEPSEQQQTGVREPNG